MWYVVVVFEEDGVDGSRIFNVYIRVICLVVGDVSVVSFIKVVKVVIVDRCKWNSFNECIFKKYIKEILEGFVGV